MIHHHEIDDGRITSKLHKTCCCPCYIACNCLFHPCRKAVSGSKKRVMNKGFDLDLAYVHDRIIVHGFPASGLEHLYRNPRLEIRRFMDTHHEHSYKMYNFCCEYGRGYDPKIFYNRVERYPFKDHNTPPLKTMIEFADSAKEWLDKDPSNVVNMHCKAGKGRAGLMCCVLLVRTGYATGALNAMDIYDENRVTNKKGLTVTSQRKFVIFYETLWRQFWGVQGNIGDVSVEDSRKLVIPEQPKVRVLGVEVLNVKEGLVNKFKISIHKITNFGPIKLFDGGVKSGNKLSTKCDVIIEENFKVFVQFGSGALGSMVRLVELQHNTLFMNRNEEYVDFAVDQLDIKKKFRPKIGESVVLRLHLGIGENSASNALITTDKNDNYTNAIDNNEVGIELSNKVGNKNYALVKVSDTLEGNLDDNNNNNDNNTHQFRGGVANDTTTTTTTMNDNTVTSAGDEDEESRKELLQHAK